MMSLPAWSALSSAAAASCVVPLAASGQHRARNGELIYPGTCRNGLHGRAGRAWRFRCTGSGITWQDRRLGPQQQNVSREVGDFVLRRADGFWAYQLAVVIDDAVQGITHIVRGEDLTDNTARQILLQQALSLPLPVYMHTPLVLGSNGEKLSKQNGAEALDSSQPLVALEQAGRVLGFEPDRLAAQTPADWLQQALVPWQQRLASQGRPAT